MIASLRRPSTVISVAVAAWLLAAGIALTAANVVPTTRVGSLRVPLPEALLPATIRIEPGTINVGSGGQGGTVTVFITLSSPHSGADIVPSSVEICVLQRCVSSDGGWTVEGNGTFHAEFGRDAIRDVLYGAHGWVPLSVDGQLSTAPGRFQGSHVVDVIR